MGRLSLDMLPSLEGYTPALFTESTENKGAFKSVVCSSGDKLIV